MMTRSEISKLMEKSIKTCQREGFFPEFSVPEIKIERPKEKLHGDYSTNVAIVIAKIVKKNPLEIAETIKSKIKNQKSKIFDIVKVAKPGFINFFLSKEYLQSQVEKILEKGKKFGELDLGKGKKVQVEFISANPTGPLHIGNGRGAFFGDTLSNVLEKAGFGVTREYYVNDAKANTQVRILGQTALGKGITYLTSNLKSKIEKLKPKLKRISDDGEAGHLLAQEIRKDIKDFIEKKLKLNIDNWLSEEGLYQESKIDKAYKLLKKKNLVYKKEGAEWLKTSEFGDEKDRVIIRKDGLPTYLLSDVAYHKDKFDRGFQKIINVWGADHQGHVSKMKAVAKMLDFKGDLDILITQLVRLRTGKLSKRKGEIITLEWLVDEVGLDATRLFYLIKSLDTQMEFDVELAKEKSEKSPVFYVQYAYARISSILKKIGIKNKKLKIITKNLKLLKHPSELDLIKQLIRLPELVADTSKDYQVQRLPQYAIDLATSFHQFYRDCRVLTENKPLSEARLALILATKTVLKNTLSLMGISAPERM
jgi:arginyl-tRNA synthetase